MEGSFAFYVLMAFLGGIILNVMPCVLPVLTMKVFHLIEHSEQDAATHRLHGIAYGAGVISTFVVLAVVLLVLKTGGELVGWGMQFSNPSFVAAMVAVVFVFGLNALGVFEFNVSVNEGKGHGGYVGSAVNGVVASIMSTPCSAPFLGSAAGFALSSAAAWQTMTLFVVIGAGLAFPFVVFSFIPAAGRMLPRPGAWMETFKHLMGFTLLAAAVWLFGVLLGQVTVSAAQWFLGFLLVLAMAVWAIGRFAGPVHSTSRRAVVRTAVLVATVLAGVNMVDLEPRAAEAAAAIEGEESVIEGEIAWRPFDSALVMETLARGRPVFMDYTADWCLNCKTNERLFIEVDRIRQVFSQTQILPMKADLTVPNEEISRWLEPFPYSGIPVYVIYLPDQTYDLLPQAITTEMLAERLLAASERFPAESFE